MDHIAYTTGTWTDALAWVSDAIYANTHEDKKFKSAVKRAAKHATQTHEWLGHGTQWLGDTLGQVPLVKKHAVQLLDQKWYNQDKKEKANFLKKNVGEKIEKVGNNINTNVGRAGKIISKVQVAAVSQPAKAAGRLAAKATTPKRNSSRV